MSDCRTSYETHSGRVARALAMLGGDEDGGGVGDARLVQRRPVMRDTLYT